MLTKFLDFLDFSKKLSFKQYLDKLSLHFFDGYCSGQRTVIRNSNSQAIYTLQIEAMDGLKYFQIRSTNSYTLHKERKIGESETHFKLKQTIHLTIKVTSSSSGNL